jgi:hypothetical protein
VMQPNGTIAVEPRLSVDIVAQQIVDIARLPPEAVVPFLTIMPLGTPLFGRG